MTRNLFLMSVMSLLAACAATDKNPIVDMRGVNESQYIADVGECSTYAEQVDLKQELILQSIFGAIAIGSIGVIVGDSGIAEQAVGIGAVSGASQGAVNVIDERNRVMRQCMLARGYVVFN